MGDTERGSGPGLRFSTVREVSGGAEDIDIRVSVRRVSGARPGRVERGGIDMIPNFFSDLCTSDTTSWSRGFSVGATASIPLGTQNSFAHYFRTLGIGASYSRSRSGSQTTGIGKFDFGVRAALYGGPLRTFDYDVDISSMSR